MEEQFCGPDLLTSDPAQQGWLAVRVPDLPGALRLTLGLEEERAAQDNWPPQGAY